MKTFKQHSKINEQKIDLDKIVDVHQFEYHIVNLFGDLLNLMWRATKFLVVVGGGFVVKSLYNRYNKEAREHRKQLKILNTAIKQERKSKAKAVMIVGYTKAAEMAEAEKKLLKKLSPEQRKEYGKDLKVLESNFDRIISVARDAIKAVKARV